MKKIITEGYTFDDVLLVPQKSEVLPNEAILKTKITEHFELNIPIISAAMDTLTEHKMAIKMACLGGLGIIHKNMTVEAQVQEVALVKNHPYKHEKHLHAITDTNGKLRVGAAIGVSNDVLERTAALLEAGADLLVIDSAHGHSEGILKTVKKLRKLYPDLPIVAGNIVTAQAALDLVEAGASAVKVGVGPGSICTTRIMAGVGVPQITALMNIYEVLEPLNIPIIADGGIKYSGDIVKAIAAGAHVVMLGSLLAGTDEAVGETIEINQKKYKSYRGMGSIAAMNKGSKDRYFQTDSKKMTPEGIEGLMPYKGKTEDVIQQLVGGLRSGMGYCGVKTIDELIKKGEFVKISPAGLKESHPHSVVML